MEKNMSNMEFVGNCKLKKVTGTNGRPDWEYHQLSFTLEDLDKMKSFLNKDGFVGVDIKTSQKGNLYMAIDTYEILKERARQNEQPQPTQNTKNEQPVMPAREVPEFDEDDGFAKEEPF